MNRTTIPADWLLTDSEKDHGRYWTTRILEQRFRRPHNGSDGNTDAGTVPDNDDDDDSFEVDW